MPILNPCEDTPHYTPRLLWLWNHPCRKLTGFFTSISTRNTQCANLIFEISSYVVKISCNVFSSGLGKEVNLSFSFRQQKLSLLHASLNYVYCLFKSWKISLRLHTDAPSWLGFGSELDGSRQVKLPRSKRTEAGLRMEDPRSPTHLSIGCQPFNPQCFTGTVLIILYCCLGLVPLCLRLSLSVKLNLPSVHRLCATYLTSPLKLSPCLLKSL